MILHFLQDITLQKHQEEMLASLMMTFAAMRSTANNASMVETRKVVGTLTPRERCVLFLLGDGLSAKEVSSKLVLSPSTACVHIQNVLKKLGVSSRTQNALLARTLRP